jgi:HNH endonuclease
MIKITENEAARFDAKVAKSEEADGCWIWTAAAFANGYGAFRRGKLDQGRKTVRAHRFSYERACGSIPSGQVVRHRCRNILCVRPAHLTIGTHQDNTDDRYADWTMYLPDFPLTAPECEFVRSWIDDLGHSVKEAADALGGLRLRTIKKGLRLGREARDVALAAFTFATVAETQRRLACRAVTGLALAA